MLRIVAAGRDAMHVDVERLRRRRAVAPPVDQPQALEPRLLRRFAARDGGGIGIAVGMSSGLEPGAELAMQDQQRLLAIGRSDPGRAGDVAVAAGALEAIGMGLDETTDRLGAVSILGKADLVAIEQDRGARADAWSRYSYSE